MTNELQAQRIAKLIEKEKLCDDPNFRLIVDHFLLLKEIQGRMIVVHDDGGMKVEPVIWSKGHEQIILEALKKNA